MPDAEGQPPFSLFPARAFTPRNAAGRSVSAEWPARAALILILLVAAVVRLYALDVLELLHDEALVADAALHDTGYIFRRAMASDAHPPYFYLLTKAYMLAGTSEGALRLVSALTGIAAVAALHRLGRRVGGSATGLYASALLAGHMLHVELSRVLRPHSLTILLTILAGGLFLDLLEKRDKASLLRLMLANLALSFLHFNTLLVVGAQMAMAGAFLLLGLLRPVRYGLAFLGLCLAVLPVNLWFAVARMGKFAGVETGVPMSWTAWRSVTNLHELLALAPFPAVSWAGWLLAAAGFYALFKHSPRTGWVILGFILLPPLALTAARYGIIYEPWHVALLAPFLLLACGRALAMLPVPAPLGASALALALGAYLLPGSYDKLYAPHSYMFNHSLGQRDLARTLTPMLEPGVMTAFGDPAMSDFTNWYLLRFSTRDLTRFQLEGKDAGLVLVTLHPPQPSDAPGARLAEALGTPAEVTNTPVWTVRRYAIPRDPGIVFDTLPASVTLSANAEQFLAKATSARGITPMLSPLMDALAPLRYGAPAQFTYRVENRSGTPATGLRLRVALGNSQPDNSFTLTVRFDNGPPETVFVHSLVNAGDHVSAVVRRPQGFSSAEIACSMLCPDSHPDFHNIPSSIVYRGMDLALEGGNPAFDHGTALVEAGLGGIDEGPGGPFRWGMGPETQLFFVPAQAGDYELDLAGSSPFEGQAVDVLLDGKPVSRLEFPRQGSKAGEKVRFTAQPGNRLITLRYARFNHGPGGAFAPGDGRTMALAWSRLTLSPADGGESKLVFVEQ